MWHFIRLVTRLSIRFLFMRNSPVQPFLDSFSRYHSPCIGILEPCHHLVQLVVALKRPTPQVPMLASAMPSSPQATSTEAVTPLGASRTRFRLRKSQLIPSWNGQRNQKIVCPLRSINLFQTSYVQTKFNQIPLVILLSISKVFQTCEPHQLRQHLNHLFRISAGSYYLCKSKPFFT